MSNIRQPNGTQFQWVPKRKLEEPGATEPNAPAAHPTKRADHARDPNAPAPAHQRPPAQQHHRPHRPTHVPSAPRETHAQPHRGDPARDPNNLEAYYRVPSTERAQAPGAPGAGPSTDGAPGTESAVPQAPQDPPLLVTLAIDEASEKFFNDKRKQYFPAHRNYLDAHITLFHALPSDAEWRAKISSDLESLASYTVPFVLAFTTVISLGRGAAVRAPNAKKLEHLHQVLSRKWFTHLTPQDKQPFKTHITIQNKVTKEEADTTLAALRAEWKEVQSNCIGFHLWEYHNGPWKHIKMFPFQSKPAAPAATSTNASEAK